jgi:hypothetical protein
LAVGIPAALAIPKFTESQLHGVKAFDALVLAGGDGPAITAAMAADIPARAASRIDPRYVLR